MRKIKKLERKLRHNCPSCQAVYTLLETHLAQKNQVNCPANCFQVWEALLSRY